MEQDKKEKMKKIRDGKTNELGIVEDTRLKKLPHRNQKPADIFGYPTIVTINNIVGFVLRDSCVRIAIRTGTVPPSIRFVVFRRAYVYLHSDTALRFERN